MKDLKSIISLSNQYLELWRYRKGFIALSVHAQPVYEWCTYVTSVHDMCYTSPLSDLCTTYVVYDLWPVYMVFLSICPVDPGLSVVNGEAIRPVDVVLYYHRASLFTAIHSSFLNLGSLTPVSPVHVPVKCNKPLKQTTGMV